MAGLVDTNQGARKRSEQINSYSKTFEEVVSHFKTDFSLIDMVFSTRFKVGTENSGEAAFGEAIAESLTGLLIP